MNGFFFKRIGGALFLLTGILVNPWTLTLFIRPTDGQVSFESRLIIIVFECFCFLIAIYISSSPDFKKRILFSSLTVIIVVVALEIGLRILFMVTSVTKDKDYKFEPFELYKRAPYQGKPWAKKVFEEYINITTKPVPYVGFQLDELHGEFTNIDANGIRRSWNPQTSKKEQPKSIYVFGGSTILGYGARDEYTIPSFLSKILHSQDYNFHVVNYGGSGTTFATEVIRLVVLLRDGHKPDYVIFYDGNNDVAAGYGGRPRDLNKDFKNVFHAGMPNYTFLLFRTGLTGLFRENCMLYRALTIAKKQFTESKLPQQAVADQDLGNVELFSKEIIAYYLESKQLLDHLAKVYGFQYLCFWQPNAFLDEELLPEDQEAASLWFKEKFNVELHRWTRDRFNQMTAPHFYNISDALDQVKEPVYADWCHIAEEGNAIVAQKMYDVLEKYYLKQKNHKATD